MSGAILTPIAGTFPVRLGGTKAARLWIDWPWKPSTEPSPIDKAGWATLVDAQYVDLALKSIGAMYRERRKDGTKGELLPAMAPDPDGFGHLLPRNERRPSGTSRSIWEPFLPLWMMPARGGLAAHFDALISCDDLGVGKPHPRVYEEVKKRSSGDSWLVAAHAWDVAGAITAGMRGIWLPTGEHIYPDFLPAPEFYAENLSAASEYLVRAR